MHLFDKCHCCRCSEFNLSLLKAERQRKKLIEDSILRENILSSSSQHPPPGCVWAQRSSHLMLSICLTDVRDQTIQLEATKLFFKAVGGSDNKCYQVEMEFFKQIDVKVGELSYDIMEYSTWNILLRNPDTRFDLEK